MTRLTLTLPLPLTQAIRREEEKAEEEQFRKAMLDKFAEDDRLDQVTPRHLPPSPDVHASDTPSWTASTG